VYRVSAHWESSTDRWAVFLFCSTGLALEWHFISGGAALRIGADRRSLSARGVERCFFEYDAGMFTARARSTLH
jgi:hypothetical protein